MAIQQKIFRQIEKEIDMIIHFQNGKSLVLSDHVICNITKYRQRQCDCERGGILVGKISSDGREFHITDFSTPTKYDKSTKTSFIRSKKSAQEFINNSWTQSDGYENYIGEWHTHPAKIAKPSFVDNKLLRASFESNVLHTECLFMIILSDSDSNMITKNDYVGYYCLDKNKLMELDRNDE